MVHRGEGDSRAKTQRAQRGCAGGETPLSFRSLGQQRRSRGGRLRRLVRPLRVLRVFVRTHSSFFFRGCSDSAQNAISALNRTLQNSHAKTLRRQDGVGGVRSLAIRVLGLNGLPDLRACGAAVFLANDADRTTSDRHTTNHRAQHLGVLA